MNKKATEKQSVNVGRICVILVGLLAAILARDPNSEVLSLVSHAWAGFGAAFGPLVVLSLTWRRMRSEEHTSELQSLMRISSAVFCLKKQNRLIAKKTEKI